MNIDQKPHQMPYEIVIQDPVKQMAPGKSYFWDAPQLPPELSYPFLKDEEGQLFPYTFICQINCADLQSVEPEESLPEQGMLYFFGDIDYFIEGVKLKKRDFSGVTAFLTSM